MGGSSLCLCSISPVGSCVPWDRITAVLFCGRGLEDWLALEAGWLFLGLARAAVTHGFGLLAQERPITHLLPVEGSWVAHERLPRLHSLASFCLPCGSKTLDSIQ